MTPRIRFTLVVGIGAGVGALLIGLLSDRGLLVPLPIAAGVGSAVGAWLIWPWIEARQKRD